MNEEKRLFGEYNFGASTLVAHILHVRPTLLCRNLVKKIAFLLPPMFSAEQYLNLYIITHV